MKKILGLAAIGVMAGILATTTALPASAQVTPRNKCGADHFCLFSDANFGGTKLEVSGDVPDLAAKKFNDVASSMINNTLHTVKLYLDSAKQAPNESPVYFAKFHTEDKSFSDNGCNDAVSRIVIEKD